jgi:hypothetical protein
MLVVLSPSVPVAMEPVGGRLVPLPKAMRCVFALSVAANALSNYGYAPELIAGQAQSSPITTPPLPGVHRAQARFAVGRTAALNANDCGAKIPKDQLPMSAVG